MARVYLLLFIINLVLAVAALIDCLSAEEDEIRALPRLFWVLIILLFSPIGPIAWFIAGRPQRTAARPGGAWRPGNGFPEATRPRPLAPDDDPAFLANLNQVRKDDEELLRRWEEDLRRREEELRNKDEDDRKS
ncbi:PLD nuclease N-terminal domain-containing protein [Luedemannella helvata]|uniref:PLD nuclease N-terminal domain-containing protein n=1 Tax=Luedemannella helvata TaxID=349315 RepID=UPI0031D0939D